jgi:hypothetical protein
MVSCSHNKFPRRLVARLLVPSRIGTLAKPMNDLPLSQSLFPMRSYKKLVLLITEQSLPARHVCVRRMVQVSCSRRDTLAEAYSIVYLIYLQCTGELGEMRVSGENMDWTLFNYT